MKYAELEAPWQRVFALAWESAQHGSKAIGAVITDETGAIVSEGRNRIAEPYFPNARTAHAETEAVQKLHVPDPHVCTLYAGLEPCVMCMGTLVMGGIRHLVIGASDAYGGACALLDANDFLRARKPEIQRIGGLHGEMQRAFQTVRELLLSDNPEKCERMLADFSVYNRAGTEAAKKLVRQGFFEGRSLSDFTAEAVFDALAELI